MSISEACQVWIEQRIQEELEIQPHTGKSLRSIGKDIAKEIEKVFEAKVNPHTIDERARRMLATNVAPQPTAESANEIPNNKTNKGTPRKRKKGGGRKPKYISDEKKSFLEAFEKFMSAVEKLRINNWKSVTRQEVLEKIQNILILIEE